MTIVTGIHDFRILLLWKWDLHSSGMLHRIDWWIPTFLTLFGPWRVDW